LCGCAGLDFETTERLLEHPDPEIRAWCIRLLGDNPPVSAQVAERLVEHAAREPDAMVRAQLACTARRLESWAGLAVAHAILVRDLDAQDPHLPLLLWWAVESHAIQDRARTLARFTFPGAWRSSMIQTSIRPRLVRRYALEQTAAGDAACVRLLASSRSV